MSKKKIKKKRSNKKPKYHRTPDLIKLKYQIEKPVQKFLLKLKELYNAHSSVIESFLKKIEEIDYLKEEEKASLKKDLIKLYQESSSSRSFIDECQERLNVLLYKIEHIMRLQDQTKQLNDIQGIIIDFENIQTQLIKLESGLSDQITNFQGLIKDIPKETQ